MARELSLSLEAAENELFACVDVIMTRNGIPCYLMQPIVEKLNRILVDGKNRELANARQREAAEKAKAEEQEETKAEEKTEE